MKICSKCSEEKEFSEFYPKRASKDGYDHHCKVCEKVRKEVNRQKINARAREYYRSNKKDHNSRCQEYYRANREEIITRIQKYREANKEKIKSLRQKYYEANKEKLKAQDRLCKANRIKLKQSLEVA